MLCKSYEKTKLVEKLSVWHFIPFISGTKSVLRKIRCQQNGFYVVKSLERHKVVDSILCRFFHEDKKVNGEKVSQEYHKADNIRKVYQRRLSWQILQLSVQE